MRAKSPFNDKRRAWLRQAGALSMSMAIPRVRAANGSEAPRVDAAPRIALVIGNAQYPEAPLSNPANDARAMGAELRKLGFDVTTKLELGRTGMLEAISAYTSSLARRKAVGLFYYAGHGSQLAWRNFLLPVDATIESIDDMRSKTVDLAVLLEGLNNARNPMNIIILDACRDNPYGNRIRVFQKGLSQFDAPPGSLLAYATAPGNVAADGEGANGLYTGNLIRELAETEMKIEDVFKRVRLNVRRASKGRQIPWESTSLENDFYFRPPANAGKRSEEESEHQFSIEAALWENINRSRDPAVYERYLRQYPSGRFSEVAQFALDQALARLGEKKVEPVTSPENPFSKGTIRPDVGFRVGDTFTYRELELGTRLVSRTYTDRVTAVSDVDVIFNGRTSADLLGNGTNRGGGRFGHSQVFVPEYSIGRTWQTRYVRTNSVGADSPVEYEYRVVDREKVTVPAGSFDAFKVVGKGWTVGRSGSSVTLTHIYWFSSDVRRPVAQEFTSRRQRATASGSDANARHELVAFQQS